MQDKNPVTVDWKKVEATIRDFFFIRSFAFIGTGNEIVYTRGKETFRFTEHGERLICRQLCDADTSLAWLQALKNETGHPERGEAFFRQQLIEKLKKMYRES